MYINITRLCFSTIEKVVVRETVSLCRRSSLESEQIQNLHAANFAILIESARSVLSTCRTNLRGSRAPQRWSFDSDTVGASVDIISRAQTEKEWIRLVVQGYLSVA